MMDEILPPHRFDFVERDFSAGHVFNRTFQVFSHNFLPFCLISFVASLPNVLTYAPRVGLVAPGSVRAGLMLMFGGLAVLVLGPISQAALLYGAFDDMRGRPVDLIESLKVGLRRFFPVLGAAICVVLLAALAAVVLLVPGLMVITMQFVAIPVCVVERLGPIKSMGRSARLTKGHRWKIFGLWFAMLIFGLIAQAMVERSASLVGGPILGLIAILLWSAVWGALNAILAVVTYHDLRVAKEGVDTDQIAAVFD